MDVFSREKRSDIMSRIGGKNTKPELIVRSLLHGMGYRFRLHKKDLPGKPDVCLPKYKTVVFVHGCYWHRHAKCKSGQRVPSTNTGFWEKKFNRTVERDKKHEKALKALGWKVLTVWECELSDSEAVGRRLGKSLNC